MHACRDHPGAAKQGGSGQAPGGEHRTSIGGHLPFPTHMLTSTLVVQATDRNHDSFLDREEFQVWSDLSGRGGGGANPNKKGAYFTQFIDKVCALPLHVWAYMGSQFRS